MEQKRTLWIVSAVGVFLLVVVGAALIMYSPAAKKSYSTAPALSKSPVSSQVLPPPPAQTFNADEVPVMPQPETFDNKKDSITAENLTVYATNTTVYGSEMTTIDLNELKSGTSAAVTEKKESSTISKVEPKYESNYDSSKSNSSKPVSEQPAVAKNPVKVSAPVSKPAPAATSKPAAARKPSKTTVAKTTSSKPAVSKPAAPAKADRFWIQVASYEMKKNADEARSVLEKNKIQAEVFTTQVKGKMYYRVRVGPYTTKSEAQYWKELISRTETFAKTNSYIVNE